MTPQLKHLFAFAVLSLGAPLIAQSAAWQIDPAHSTVLFTVRHLGVSNVHGSFTNIAGTVNIDDKDITKSSVEATIDTTTVNTDNPDRDKDLKSPHFFDVAKYPTATFKSKQVINSAGKLQVIGTLTLHGVSKDVTLDLEQPSKIVTAMGKQRRGLSGSTTLNRRDFGLVSGGNLPSGDAMIGDTVKVTLEVELIQ
ncbi:MAG TPA: YceI family protein [Acidobacteriaceae bacterium]|nr:YceI family protein [Acidobacteriaceae bacterium]